MIISSKELKEQRLEVCKTCEWLEEKKVFKVDVLKCKKCGCNLNAKAMMVRMKCPLGKW